MLIAQRSKLNWNIFVFQAHETEEEREEKKNIYIYIRPEKWWMKLCVETRKRARDRENWSTSRRGWAHVLIILWDLQLKTLLFQLWKNSIINFFTNNKWAMWSWVWITSVVVIFSLNIYVNIWVKMMMMTMMHMKRE